MIYLKNVSSTTVITLGAMQFTILPLQEISLSDPDFFALKSEIAALEAQGYLSVNAGVPFELRNRVRDVVSGVGTIITPANIVSGIVSRITTIPISDALPSATDLANWIGAEIGTFIDFNYTHVLGGADYIFLGSGTGNNFVDDWGYYSNNMLVRSGCVVNLMFVCTSVSPFQFIIKVLSNTGGLSVDQGLSPRYAIKVPVTITSASPQVYTPGELAGGMILRDPSGTLSVIDWLPTPANLVSYLANPMNGDFRIGSFVEFSVRSIGGVGEDVVLSSSPGCTLYANGVVASVTITAGTIENFVAVITNKTTGAEAYTVYLK